MMAAWFPTTSGVRQGDVLSPTLFSLFVNDLALEVKRLNRGTCWTRQVKYSTLRG